MLAKILEESLTAPTPTADGFMAKITALSKKLQSFKVSIEYLQDFVHIYGLKMFYEEFEKLIYSYVDMEKTALENEDAGYEELNYDEDVPVPTLKDPEVNTFMGFLLREILNLTNSKRTTFILTSYTFYNIENGSEVFSLKMLNILHQCIGISGLQGLDYLLALKIKKTLTRVLKYIRGECEEENIRRALNKCYESLRNVSSFTDRYEHSVMALKKMLKVQCAATTKDLIKIGQYMILRDMICLELRMLSKVGSPRLFLCLENINHSLLNDMTRPQSEADQEDKINNENLLLVLMNPYFKHLGMLEPMKKIFLTCDPIEHLPLYLFTLLNTNVPAASLRLPKLITTRSSSRWCALARNHSSPTTS